MKLVFATHNKHKVSEIKPILPSFIGLISTEDIGCNEEIPETGSTLEENALQKAMYVYENYNHNSFADDTGLEVKALNGAPGVYSARYAGEGRSAEENVKKLLNELEDCDDRSAVFKTMIALVMDGETYLFEGSVKGSIAKQRYGDKGFGYDPVFIPDGYSCTFAQMTMEEKNAISHRATAVKKFVEFLKKQG
jgi:XTP/dITP diphosphohydrolase